MADAVMEMAVGTIDGANREFATSGRYYVSGSVRVFTPTLQAPVSVTELGQDRFEVDDAPMEGDLLYVYYLGL